MKLVVQITTTHIIDDCVCEWHQIELLWDANILNPRKKKITEIGRKEQILTKQARLTELHEQEEYVSLK